jgi:uncharacterized SAM-binding protein YcdF (DUF218 family)
VVTVVVVGAGLPLYVWPTSDVPRPADAIVILGGNGYGRYPFGFQLASDGFAPEVVVSNPIGADDPWLAEQCREHHPEYKILCFIPDPPTTAGEAKQLKRLAAEQGWKTIIVVTFQPHVARARFIVQQCFDGEVIMVPSPADVSILQWAYQYVYQTAGFIKAILKPAC